MSGGDINNNSTADMAKAASRSAPHLADFPQIDPAIAATCKWCVFVPRTYVSLQGCRVIFPQHPSKNQQ
jgi:hypothetical protein